MGDISKYCLFIVSNLNHCTKLTQVAVPVLVVVTVEDRSSHSNQNTAMVIAMSKLILLVASHAVLVKITST